MNVNTNDYLIWQSLYGRLLVEFVLEKIVVGKFASHYANVFTEWWLSIWTFIKDFDIISSHSFFNPPGEYEIIED